MRGAGECGSVKELDKREHHWRYFMLELFAVQESASLAGTFTSDGASRVGEGHDHDHTREMAKSCVFSL